MPTTCWESIRAQAMRVTKLDACSAPVIGAKSQLATDGFVSVTASPQYEDGTETKMTKANGRLAFVDKSDDDLKWFQIEAKFTGVNPDIGALMLGQPLVLDEAGNAVGIRYGAMIRTNFGLETWTDIPGMTCASGAKMYGYFLWPFLKGARLADIKLENGALDFTLQNAISQPGSGWGKGPYDVVLQAAVGEAPPVAGPLLTDIGAGDHFHQQLTAVPPPTLGCAAIALAA